MQYPLSIGLLIACASATALARPDASLHPRVGQLAELTFAPGSAEIVFDTDGKVAAKLDRAASWAHENPDGLVVLDGHADRVGSEPVNLQLSMQRAKAVRDRLIEAGADIGEIQRLGNEWSLFFRDPDGMELEVCCHADE